VTLTKTDRARVI